MAPDQRERPERTSLADVPQGERADDLPPNGDPPVGPRWSALPVPEDAPRPWAATLDRTPAGTSDHAYVLRMREVEALRAAAAGAALSAWLEELDPDDLTTTGLVEAVAASARAEAAQHARTALLAAALARREEMDPWANRLDGPPRRQSSVAGDVLAMRLGTSRAAASTIVAEGVAYDGHLQATGEALARGEIDVAKARVLVQRLGDLPFEITGAVEDRVLPGAGDRTPVQVRRDVERALLEIDPEDALDRHARSRSGRRVGRPRAEADGMASMRLLLPAEDALSIDGVLDHAARAARAAGDGRTSDQLRADGLRDLVVGSDEPLGDGPAWEVGHVVTGDGPDAAVMDLFRPLRAAGAVCDADRAVADAIPPGRTRRELTLSDTSTLSDPPHRSRASTRSGRRPGAQVWLTVPASTLLGVDDGPADLHGYGPVHAVQARALAADGAWRRVVTDPLSGAVLDVGRERYRPPAALAEHVRVRDRECVRPGCTVPSTRADLDHTEPFHRQPGDPPDRTLGTTSVDNLGPLCARDHRLKTDGGFTLRQVSPGVYEWTTPAGHRYLTRPGTDEVVDVTTSAPDEPPPF